MLNAFWTSPKNSIFNFRVWNYFCQKIPNHALFWRYAQMKTESPWKGMYMRQVNPAQLLINFYVSHYNFENFLTFNIYLFVKLRQILGVITWLKFKSQTQNERPTLKNCIFWSNFCGKILLYNCNSITGIAAKI